jgi:hypothetical protein
MTKKINKGTGVLFIGSRDTRLHQQKSLSVAARWVKLALPVLAAFAVVRQASL